MLRGWRRRRARHGLAEPIPGAPALTLQGDWRASAQRLRQAIGGFQAASGPLKPHFAYGALSRADYALAHSMHIANHQDEIAVVMTDQRVPGEQGVQFLERARRLRPQIIRILASAFADLDAAIGAS